MSPFAQWSYETGRETIAAQIAPAPVPLEEETTETEGKSEGISSAQEPLTVPSATVINDEEEVVPHSKESGK